MMKKVLILCTGNSCRSQMAEGWLRHFANDKAEIYSAGVETHGLNPRAVLVMAESGIDISGHRSELVDKYLNSGIDIVITVCDHAAEVCPIFPGEVKRFHQSFPDPAKVEGNVEDVLFAFRKVRDEIRDFSEQFAAENI